MNIFDSIDQFSTTTKTVATLGTFDGVHLGHQKIISQLTQESQIMGCQSLVLTFQYHPRTFLNQKSDVKLLTSTHEKAALLAAMGLQNLVIHPFDAAFSSLSARDFVEKILVKKFNISKIIIGHDHRFGQNRSADFDDLVKFGKEFGFEVAQISAKAIDQIAISSTKIRNALTDGDIHLANNYLGYQYSFSGTVVKGKQLGRTIGVPTANIAIENDQKLIPKSGVYIVKSTIDKKVIFGMMNIGNRPTVNGETETIEVHFLDFDDDLYGKPLTINILNRLRDEQKFDSLHDLKNQIQNDKEKTIAYLLNLQ